MEPRARQAQGPGGVRLSGSGVRIQAELGPGIVFNDFIAWNPEPAESGKQTREGAARLAGLIEERQARLDRYAHLVRLELTRRARARDKAEHPEED